ncbi:MAG: EamA family transporter [Micromonosporaceae bacterium]
MRGTFRLSAWFEAAPPPMLVMGGIVSIQVGAAFAKQLFDQAGPAGVVALRLFFAAILLLLWWRPGLRMTRHDWALVIAFGAVLGLMNFSFYQSFARIPLGMAVTIEFLGPLSVALLGSRRWRDALWALLAGAGVVLLTDGGGDVNLAGVLLALVAAACWAAYIVLGARMGQQTSGGAGLALGTAFAAIVVVPVGAVESGTALLSPHLLAVGLAVAVMSSVVPYSLEIEALRRMPTRVFGVLMSLEPAVAALAGLAVLGERLSLPQWLAIGCVVIASIGAARGAKLPPRDA